MGRILHRVPLDFTWPHNKPWKGYLNPHVEDHMHRCEDCSGSGESPQAREMSRRWYGYLPFKPEDRGSVPFTTATPAIRQLAERNVAHSPEYYGTGEFAIEREARRLCTHFNQRWQHHLNDDDVAALLADNRLMDFTHTHVRGEGWLKREDAPVPTAREVNEWSLVGMGHDSINQWVVVKAECERLGADSVCPTCKGEGHTWSSEEAKQRAESWEREDPPVGEGYQLWETVSEGSPISPVFATPEELASWLVDNPHGIDEGTTFEQWMAFIAGPGWAPSFVGTSAGLLSGVQAVEPLALPAVPEGETAES